MIRTRVGSVLTAAAIVFAACAGFDDASAQSVSVLSNHSALRTKILLNGAEANAGWGDALSSGFVDVTQASDGTSIGTKVWLSFSLSSVDPASQVCITDPETGASFCSYTLFRLTTGYGEIDPSSFKASKKSAVLNATFADGTNFALQTCILDSTTGNQTCSTAAPGSISLTWSKVGDYAAYTSGTSKVKQGGFATKSTGTTRQVSGIAKGTVYGILAPSANGFISQNSNVTRERTPAQPNDP